MADDLQKTGDGTGKEPATPPSPKTPSGGQSDENWEARFKGLQTTFNTLQKDHGKMELSLQAKDTFATETLTELNELKSTLSSSNVEYEGQLTAKSAELVALNATLTERDTEIATFKQQAVAVAEDKQIRDQLSKHADILPFFDKGLLNLRGDDGKPLEGEALDTKIDAFKAELGSKWTQDFDYTLKGTVPSPKTPPAGPIKGGSEEELQTWLLENSNHPDYENVNDRYIGLVEKRFSGSTP
jgi:hypothetical protein